jgi:hypothetical protein
LADGEDHPVRGDQQGEPGQAKEPSEADVGVKVMTIGRPAQRARHHHKSRHTSSTA